VVGVGNCYSGVVWMVCVGCVVVELVLICKSATAGRRVKGGIWSCEL
jgi:hypothetical protein